MNETLKDTQQNRQLLRHPEKKTTSTASDDAYRII